MPAQFVFHNINAYTVGGPRPTRAGRPARRGVRTKHIALSLRMFWPGSHAERRPFRNAYLV
eukprot:7145337-Pyramimonas_sp.AAC.1